LGEEERHGLVVVLRGEYKKGRGKWERKIPKKGKQYKLESITVNIYIYINKQNTEKF
jgi:hypothetical protein